MVMVVMVVVIVVRGHGSVAVLYHQRPVQVGIHIGSDVEGSGDALALLGVQLAVKRLTARTQIVASHLRCALLPYGHHLLRPLLLPTGGGRENRGEEWTSLTQRDNVFI